MRAGLCLALVGALGFVFLMRTEKARAAFSGSNGKIAFVSVNGGDSGIYTVNPDGTSVTRLSPTPGVDGQPDFSGDGSKIVFSSNAGDTLGRDIFVMNADGSARVDVSNYAAYDADPAFSPDGTKIAFISSRDGTNALWVMNADGSNQHLLSTASWDNGCWSGFPRWSPDGTKIAFQQEYQCSGHASDHDIFVVNADGSGTPVDITSNDRSDDTLPEWSPDGKKIAYVSNSTGSQVIYTINSDGSGTPTQIASGSRPAWSPDGTQIAYVSASAIYRIASDGSGTSTLVDDTGGDDAPDWQPLPADTTPPQITISTPAAGGAYPQNSSVTADYACADPGGSGVASCSGPVANGSALGTSTPGVFSFTVQAADAAGNTASSTSTYDVFAPATVTTGGTHGVTAAAATLLGIVNPNYGDTSYWFQYGTDSSYGQQTPTRDAGITNSFSAAEDISGLQPSTTYHYRIVGQQTAGTPTGTGGVPAGVAPIYGADRTFTTPAASTPAGGGSFSAVTGAASDIQRDSATLHGQVNPAGTAATAYFEYGTSTAYGSRTPDQDAGTQDGFVAAARPVGLTPGTTYHYRVVAVEGASPVYGDDHQFTTLGPPLVTTGTASHVTGTSATLAGTINPQTSDTHYHFEYGTTPAYGTSVPTGAENDLGASDQTDHGVSVDIPTGALAPSTTYHYRLVADNQDGTTDGADRTFTTLAAPPTVDDETAANSPPVVQLRATVEPHGLGGTYTFEWSLGCDAYTDSVCASYGNPTTGATASTQFEPPMGNVVVLNGTVPSVPGQTLYVHVVVSTSAGTTTGPGTSITIPDAQPPGAETGSILDNGRGTLTLTGKITPHGWPVGYHFHVSLAGGCQRGVQALDTTEQQVAAGDYGTVTPSVQLFVPPGTTISEQLVVDYTPSAGATSVSGAVHQVRAAGSTRSGDLVNATPTSGSMAGVSVFLRANSPLAQATPASSGGGWSATQSGGSFGWGTGSSSTPPPSSPPLVVRVEYGTDTQYAESTDASTWTGDGSQPTCSFTNQFTLTNLTPGTLYHYRIVSGYWAYGADVNPYGCGWANDCYSLVFEQLAATSDQRFLTPGGGATGTPIYVPSAATISGNVQCSTSAPCSGSVKYLIQAPGVSGHARAAAKRPRRPHAIVLGSTRFRLRGHTSRQVTVKLTRAARRLLRGKRAIKVIAIVTIRAGRGRAVTTRRTLTLRPQRARGRKHRRRRRT